MSQSRERPDVLPLQTRLAPITTIDIAARTLDVVWTTGATVRRNRWVGWDTCIPFDEELIVSDAAIDFTRMSAGAPVVDSHAIYSTDMIRAVVDKHWLAGGEGLATLRFPKEGIRKSSDELFALAQDKIVRNISVGYFINRVRVVSPQKEGEIERRIIERWTPYELSFVTVPADAGAQVRSGDTRSMPVEILGQAAASRAFDIVRARLRMQARRLGIAA